jgi:hypothetical protein
MSFTSRTLRGAPSAAKFYLALGLFAGALSSSCLSAKDLYVSPSGNDGVTYAANSISTPWKTVDHGLYNLKAGDHLYIRAGTYAPRYPVWLSSDYNRQTKGGDPNERNNAQSGTSSAPVIIESYPGEQATIDLSAVTSAGNGAYIYLDNISYWTFRGLTFTNSLMVFVVAEDYPSTHNTFDGLKITANRGGDNAAAIHLWGNRAEYTTIKNCIIKGPGQNVHANTGTLYVKGVNYLKILNNVLSDAPIGIYYKHRNNATSAQQADIEVAYNYITNTSRASLEYNGSFSYIHDNIFGASTAPAHFGDANGLAGADYNRIEHNTFLSGSLHFDSAIESGDPYPGVAGNTVTNNIFQKPLEILRYSNLTNSNTLGKNLYPTASAITSFTGLLKATIDSLIGTPTYTGGSAPNSIAGFRLASGSLGKAGATDGTDIGVNVDKFKAPDTTVPTPRAPTGVTVQ